MNIKAKMIFVCNTYMQLITAIQMRKTLFPFNKADLALSDHSSNSSCITQKILESSLFDNVFYLETKQITYHQGKLTDFRDAIELSFNVGRKFQKRIWENINYDDIFYFNHNDLFIVAIYTECLKNGTVPRVHCYEEGILSYNTMATAPDGPRRKIIMNLRRLQGKTDPYEMLEDYFCFYPELFPQKNKKCYKIPFLSRENRSFVQEINAIFGYRPEKEMYQQKYIFFASSADIDGNPVGETELVLRIADKVGKENLLVKMHPRDERDVYRKYGINVSQNSAIPWEVIQMNHDFSEYVFLTVSSGSVLNASAMLDDHITTYYLFPFIRGINKEIDRFCEDSIVETLSALHKLGIASQIKIVDDLDSAIK